MCSANGRRLRDLGHCLEDIRGRRGATRGGSLERSGWKERPIKPREEKHVITESKRCGGAERPTRYGPILYRIITAGLFHVA
ncbi:hypothetical protein CesoFtcFv8_019606 [Champsocephalus esox]|uniref:Uncharacterized protein n=1 Tax=Champsocephalus esox TaxID=159716 RepID=A0AAN8BE30_9TELE|nr:hypothetical protein CesoFtcFv8_019606 [Champsocephalus esox]